MEELKAKIESLEKENLKLNRTIKLLRKKVSRLRNREEALTSEIAELDMLDSIDAEVNKVSTMEEQVGELRCPSCGHPLEFMDVQDYVMGLCPKCMYRKSVKNNSK